MYRYPDTPANENTPVHIGIVGTRIMKKTLAKTEAELTACIIFRLIKPPLFNAFLTEPDLLPDLQDTPPDDLREACRLLGQHLFTYITEDLK